LMLMPIGRMKREIRLSTCSLSSMQRKVTGSAAALQ
jgi:hypothetical protein